jgi:hypothetical protein
MFAALCTTYSFPQMEIAEVEAPILSKAVAGVVIDPSGAEVDGVVVEERSSDWKTVLRSTTTDTKGRFHFSSKSKQTLYYLQFNRLGFDWLRITVRLRKDGVQQIPVKLHIAA